MTATVDRPVSAPAVDLHALVSALTQRLALELDTAVAAAAIARDEATSEHSKAENKYDTRAIEAGYLAGAQARRVTALRTSLGRFRVILDQRLAERSVRVFGLRSPEHAEHVLYVLAPAGAGTTFEHGGQVFRVVTPESPLGRGLVEADVDDVVAIPGQAGVGATFEVAWVVPA